ncbi:MAG TPA: YbdK family carboxylate-amine ligase [Solirubrobacteraceae bacterium]
MPPLTPAPSGDHTDPRHWRAVIDAPTAPAIGIEEELMVLDAETLDLAPRAAELADTFGADDDRIRTELPAAQLELVTRPAATVDAALDELAALRHAAAELGASRGLRLAGAGAHPFAATTGQLTQRPRYERIAAEYGPVARRQLVFGLHVHVSVRGADRALAVYNALREHLPFIAAIATNAPLYDGADTGLASVRPLLSALLPRHGIPPAFASWDELAAAHAWGRVSDRIPDAGSWWWEARLHPQWGTLEVRVPDTQATLAETGAVVRRVHALVDELATRHDAGDLPPPAPTWRIAENRWSACRYGLDAELADPRTGARTPVRELIDIDRTGADRLREVAREHGVHGATAWLAERFTA